MTTNSARWVTIALCAVALTTGCSSKSNTDPQGSVGPSANLENTNWRLARIDNEAAVSPGDRGAPFLRFVADGTRLEGSTGCNQMFGKYERNGATLRFTGIGMTKRACTEARRNQLEQQFVAALNATQRFEISGDTLRLVGGSGVVAELVNAPLSKIED
jgi:heat shock protein HslJ